MAHLLYRRCASIFACGDRYALRARYVLADSICASHERISYYRAERSDGISTKQKNASVDTKAMPVNKRGRGILTIPRPFPVCRCIPFNTATFQTHPSHLVGLIQNMRVDYIRCAVVFVVVARVSSHMLAKNIARLFSGSISTYEPAAPSQPKAPAGIREPPARVTLTHTPSP